MKKMITRRRAGKKCGGHRRKRLQIAARLASAMSIRHVWRLAHPQGHSHFLLRDLCSLLSPATIAGIAQAELDLKQVAIRELKRRRELQRRFPAVHHGPTLEEMIRRKAAGEPVITPEELAQETVCAVGIPSEGN